jgi:protein-tyrosine-phosphatase
MARTVLVVCHGNTCRSVMAQALLERMLAERAPPTPSASARAVSGATLATA